MTGSPRRERVRADTDAEIRRCARVLLAGHGSDAVTLRAIARELGITAPALYRYCGSREDLLQRLRDDICSELAEHLDAELRGTGGGFAQKVFAACRAFRRWALGHPAEFGLVFASPTGPDVDQEEADRFAGVFLRIVGPFLAEGLEHTGGRELLEFELPDLAPHQQALAEAFDSEGVHVPPEALHPEAVYFLLRWWVRVYGHVALEAFGRFPFELRHADELFDSMLHELAREVGLPT